MPDTSWTDRYSQTTEAGFPWTTDQSISAQVSGTVNQNGVNVAVIWTVLPNGDLFPIRGNGDYYVPMLTPATPYSVQTPTRQMDTAFVISQYQDARVTYQVKLPAKLIALGTDGATVALQANGVEVARVTYSMTLNVGLSIGDERDPVFTLAGIIPAGQTCKIATVQASANTAAPSIISAQEELLPQ